MTNRELLREIHRDNKAMNRNIQRLVNVGLMGVLVNVSREAKKKEDKAGKTLVKTGLLLVVMNEILLLISDIIAYKKAKAEERREALEHAGIDADNFDEVI